MKLFSKLLIGIGIITALYSCDKIEDPYITADESVLTDVSFPDLDTNVVYRKILIEEFTGHRCTGCPLGHAELDNLSTIYNDTLIAIGMHVDRNAAPSGELFIKDFRTPEGTEIYETYGNIGTPSAMVNRTEYNNTYCNLDIAQWNPAIQSIDRNQKIAAIQMINEFDNTTKKLTAHTKTTIINDYAEKVQLSLFIIEDDIIAPQINGNVIDTFYVHNHVLRGSLNGTYGTSISLDGYVEKGHAYTKSYDLNCSQKDWNFDNCKVIAILINSETKEVLQVESCPFK